MLFGDAASCVRTQFDSLGFAGSWLPALRVLFEFDCRIRIKAIHTWSDCATRAVLTTGEGRTIVCVQVVAGCL